MENYKDFLDRILSFEKPDIDFGHEYFQVNPSVVQKVAPDNTFRKFYGDTVVFHLDASSKKRLATYVERLYETTPECFCERLHTDTFHMTLHDLSNASHLQDIAGEVAENERNVMQRMKDLQPTTIRMKSTYIFNMVNTSLVFGLCPADEAEYHKLMNLYHIIDKVKTLPYPLTPHVTLAYYSHGGFDASTGEKLAEAVRAINTSEDSSFEVTLDTNCLYYQTFTSMNDYHDILNLSGLHCRGKLL